MNTSLTPKYDALREKVAAGLAEGRERGGIHPATRALMMVEQKAITAGQRAGERAVTRAFKPYEYEPYGSYDHGTIMRGAQEAAKVASAKARERYVVKVLG